MEQKIKEAEADAGRVQEECERLAWQVGELEKVQPQAGEWEQVNQDYDRLSHAASLLEGIGNAVNELSEADHPIVSRLSSMVQTMTGLAGIDKGLEPVVELLESSRIQLQEAVYTLRDYLAHTDLDPEQLQAVGKRMESLHTIARQFRVPPESLPEEWEKRKAQLAQYEEDNNLESLKAQAVEAETSYRTLAEQVSKKRR